MGSWLVSPSKTEGMDDLSGLATEEAGSHSGQLSVHVCVCLKLLPEMRGDVSSMSLF